MGKLLTAVATVVGLTLFSVGSAVAVGTVAGQEVEALLAIPLKALQDAG